MTYQLIFSEQADNELTAHIKAGNKRLLKKIYSMMTELTIHPQFGIGKPEQLKYELVGLWSRRIDQVHRLVYRIDDENNTVFIIQLRGHYGNK